MSNNPVGESPIERAEMESLLAVRQELGPAMEPALVDSFAQKIMAEVQRQSDIAAEAQRQHLQMEESHGGAQSGAGGRLALAIVSLVMSIPLTAIALDLGSIWMAAIVWIGIVMVNFAYAADRRGKS
ncbi:MAG: hypothetical protein ACTHWA_11680 [Arachnia sp.]